MSNSIWKTPEETPKDFCDVVLANSRTGSCCVFFSPFHNVSFNYDKWCYLDDLIAQADKAERLQKENEAMREEFEVWHGNHKCVLEDKERLLKVVFFLSGHLRDVLQLDERGHIKLDEITKQQIKTAISDPVGIIMQLEKGSNN